MPSARRKLRSGVLSFGLLALLPACSTSNGGGSSKLWGSDGNAAHQQAGRQPEPRPTTAFDADGPSAPVAYRGGRDPATGRAPEWAPAAPPAQSTSQSTAMAPLPPAAPAYPAYQPGQPSHYPPVTRPSASPPPPPYPAATAYVPAPPPPPYVPLDAQSAAQPGLGTVVDVRPGDTLYRLSRAYNVPVPTIMQANGLTSESIKVGQRLTIPVR